MKTTNSARLWVGAITAIVIGGANPPMPAAQGRGGGRRGGAAADMPFTAVLGRPTDHTSTLNVLSPRAIDAFSEYGTTAGKHSAKTAATAIGAGQPTELTIENLAANTRYFYRVQQRPAGQGDFTPGIEQSFMTQRAAGSTFSFGVQGDSHPERDGKMFSADLYVRTMERVKSERPDLYFMLGDDFSIERLIAGNQLTQANVDEVYAQQRPFVSRMAGSTSLFLVNGNHEEAGKVLLDGTATCAPVLAGIARTKYYALPAPDAVYTGDAEPVEHVGLLRDYYAFTWGDALFVTIDPYWHSSIQVDADPGGRGGGGGGQGGAPGGGRGGRNAGGGGAGKGGNAMNASGLARDQWQITIGDAQYAWLKKTLETSTAKYKFVFAHHVMGTGRGAVEVADGFEWGGLDRRGVSQFKDKRPNWELPIHQLMVKNGVTIFFQGHDHLFARQEKDGLIYQEVPNPADDTYTTFNDDAYRSGTKLPNAGHLNVTVAPDGLRVDYIRSFLPKDEINGHKDGEAAFSYNVTARAPK